MVPSQLAEYLAATYKGLWTDAHRHAAAQATAELLAPVQVEWKHNATDEDLGHV